MDTFRAATAFSRFGLGRKIGDVAELTDPQAAVLAELDEPAITPHRDLPESAALYATVRDIQATRRQQRKAGAQAIEQMDADTGDKAVGPLQLMQAEARQKLLLAKAPGIGFLERLV